YAWPGTLLPNGPLLLSLSCSLLRHDTGVPSKVRAENSSRLLSAYPLASRYIRIYHSPGACQAGAPIVLLARFSQPVPASHRDSVLVGRPSFLLFQPCNNRSPLKARTKTLGAHIMHPFAEHP